MPWFDLVRRRSIDQPRRTDRARCHREPGRPERPDGEESARVAAGGPGVRGCEAGQRGAFQSVRAERACQRFVNALGRSALDGRPGRTPAERRKALRPGMMPSSADGCGR